MMNKILSFRILHGSVFNTTDLRFLALFAAIIIYALFGSPTPDDPGYIELFVGALLVFASAPFSILAQFSLLSRSNNFQGSAWQMVAYILLFYGIALVTLNGLLNDHEMTAMIRDVLPFLFMLLPVFVYPLFLKRPQYRIYLIAGILCVGICFSLRVFLPLLNLQAGNITLSVISDPFYFANAPTVLFTAVMLSAAAAFYILRAASISSWCQAIILSCLALVPLLAMISITQRATIGWYILAMCVLFAVALFRYPSRILPLLFCMIAAGISSAPYISGAFENLLQKNELVGLNMRAEEFVAVIKQVSATPLRFLFGLGWGGQFESPAVGGLSVNFTHSLITATWLKCGVIGVTLLGIYLFKLVDAFMQQLKKRPVLFLAVLGPLVIDMFLYASYKSLDFGLILLVIAVYGIRDEEKSAGNIENNSQVVASTGSV